MSYKEDSERGQTFYWVLTLGLAILLISLILFGALSFLNLFADVSTKAKQFNSTAIVTIDTVWTENHWNGDNRICAFNTPDGQRHTLDNCSYSEGSKVTIKQNALHYWHINATDQVAN